MRYLLLLMLSFVFLCCSNRHSATQEDDNYRIHNDSIIDAKLLSLYFEVKRDPCSSYIDSAMNVIDSMLYENRNKEEKQVKYAIQKVLFLTLVNKMDSAVSFVTKDKSVKWEMLGGPYFKDILKYRLLAMKAKENNDTCLFKDHIKEALGLVEKYISENEEEYASSLRTSIQEQNGKYLLTINEHIYYTFLLYGQEEADKRLMMYQEKYKLSEDEISQLRQLYNLEIMDFEP